VGREKSDTETLLFWNRFGQESVNSVAGNVQHNPAVTIKPNFGQYSLKVSAYDRAAGWLIALLVLVGSTVAILVVLWLSSRIFATQAAVPIVMEEIGSGEGGFGGGMELDAPDAEQLGEETDLEEPSLEETLSVVAQAVGTQVALLEDPTLTEQPLTGRGGSTGDGRLPGIGSGPGGSGRARRWEVRFIEGNTLETYARQLDFFGIELAVLLPGGKVQYVYNLTKRRPDTRIGPAEQEKRYYLTWRSGALQEADRELLRRAGINPQGKLILKFLPPELEAQLVQMERQRAGNDYNRVRSTLFGVAPDRNGYKFYVIDQSYR